MWIRTRIFSTNGWSFDTVWTGLYFTIQKARGETVTYMQGRSLIIKKLRVQNLVSVGSTFGNCQKTVCIISLTLSQLIDAFWRLCSRRLFENNVTKREIAKNKKFLPLPQCIQLYSIDELSFIDIFNIFV